MTAHAAHVAGPAETYQDFTIGCVVRLVGKWLGLPDSYIHSSRWPRLRTVRSPLIAYKLAKGYIARPEQSWAQYAYQLFACIGAWPRLLPCVTRETHVWHAATESSEIAATQAERGRPLSCVVLSGTRNRHGQLGTLPEGGVLVHCGEFTNFGSLAEVAAVAT